jgi:putative (di)nucleoside polyphosphate hydrolase
MPCDLPYRPCVGVMLFDRHGKVFVGKRLDQTVEAWQMPQGGIDKGEEPRAAALRELEEEIGTAKAVIVAELDEWLTYDLPEHLIGIAFHGKYKGQRQKWFALRFAGSDTDIRLDAHHPEFSAFKWIDIAEVEQVAAPFKRAIYRRVAQAFAAHAKSG